MSPPRSKKTADPSAELAARADTAAKELQALAADITKAIDTLPRWASAGTRELLEQQARRALAISAALRVEAHGPDEATTSHLLRARRAVAIAVVAAIGTITVGAGEQVGADAWEAVRSRVSAMVSDTDERGEDSSSPVPPPANSSLAGGGAPDRESEVMPTEGRFPSILRDLRERLGLTQAEFGKAMTASQALVSRIERGDHLPSVTFMERLEKYLSKSSPLTGEEVREVVAAWESDQGWTPRKG